MVGGVEAVARTLNPTVPIVVVGVQGTLILLGTYLVGYPLAKLIVSRSAWYEKAKHDLKTKGRASVGGFAIGGSGSSGSSPSSPRSCCRSAARPAARW